jgi:hypothetical protein
MVYTELSDNQRRVYIDTSQIYEAFIDAFRKSQSYSGGMHWKKAKGKEYLFKSRDRYGYGVSLGSRTSKTEKILADFRSAKKRAKDQLATLKERLKEQARFCKAAMIQRVPRVVSGILVLLDQQNHLGRNVIVIGTNAMYAYEAAAGVFLDHPLMATKDMDILWDVRSGLTLAGNDDMGRTGLIDILRKADRSFELMGPQSYRAVNRDGYMVDLIKSEPKQILKKEQRRMGGAGDLMAAEIRNLHWLISLPKFSQVVIGNTGYPPPMVTPDPRAFALHKLWISQQIDREPVKKQRDRDQAKAIAQLVVQYLPQYQFAISELRMFPKEVVLDAKKEFQI